MQLSDQTLAEFTVLTLTGIAVSVVAAILVTDYRGSLSSYVRGCWRFYQRPWYQRLFAWTFRARAYYADEARIRRTLRLVAASGLAMGVFIISIEFGVLVTGHVI